MAITKSSWTDPRGVFGSAQDPSKWETNRYTSPEAFVQYVQKQLNDTRTQMDELINEMMHLKGFYGWLMHAYPDTIAQYKAIQELQLAARESERTATDSVPMYGFGGTP